MLARVLYIGVTPRVEDTIDTHCGLVFPSHSLARGEHTLADCMCCLTTDCASLESRVPALFRCRFEHISFQGLAFLRIEVSHFETDPGIPFHVLGALTRLQACSASFLFGVNA